jgi:hypothetical protein
MATVALVVLEHTVLPVTVSVALGNGFTLTEAVSLRVTGVQGERVTRTDMVFQPLAREETGNVNETLPPVLVTGLPIAVAPKNA